MRWLLVAAALVALPAHAVAAGTIADAKCDVDADGKPDTLVLDDAGRLVVTLMDGSSPPPVKLSGGWQATGAELTCGFVPTNHRVVLVRADDPAGEGRKRATLLELDGKKLVEKWAAEIGPQGPDGEWGTDVTLTPDGVILYETRPGVARCDGAPTWLNPARFDFVKEKFRRIANPVPSASAAVTLTATRGAAPPGFDATTRPKAMRFRAASTQDGDGGSAEGLATPVELDDNKPETSWSEAHQATNGEGEFFIAQSRASGFAIVALRVIPGDAESAKAFAGANRLKRLLVFAGGGGAFAVEFPRDPAADAAAFAEPYWVVFPKPLQTKCVTVVIESVYPARSNRTAISELALLSDLDGGAALDPLAESVAAGGRDAESALKLLRDSGDAGARALVAAARKPGRKPEQRRNVRLALAQLGAAAGAEEVAAGLAEVDDGEAGAADAAHYADGLSRMGAAAIPAAAALLANDEASPRGRAAAATVLSARPEPEARAALVAACGRGPRKVRVSVVQALGGRAADELPEALGEAVAAGMAEGADGDAAAVALEADRWRVVALLAARAPAGGARAGTALVAAERLGTAKRYELRYRLVQTVAVLAGAEATARDAVARLLAKEPEPALRLVAVEALAGDGDRGPPAELLQAAAGDADPGVRAAAAAALAARGDDPHDDAVLGKLLAEDRWPVVRRTAAEALGRRCARAAPADALLLAADGDADDTVRRLALGALVACREPRIGKKLLEIARSGRQDGDLRAYAATLLGALGDTSLVPAIIDLLDAGRREAFGSEAGVKVAAAAARALGQLRDARATEALLDTLADSSFPDVQAAAAEAIGTLCPRGGRAALERARRSQSPVVGRATREALKRCNR